MTEDQILRQTITQLLTESHAHMSYEEAVDAFPQAQMNTIIPHGTYTPWHLLEHLRLAQRDILDFIRNPEYQEGNWPDDYWPPQDRKATEDEWKRTIADFQADLRTLVEIVRDTATDLHARIPHGTGQTILREMLLVADHNAYHIGEFAILRQVMGTWGKDHA
jgi:hypothetical protein